MGGRNMSKKERHALKVASYNYNMRRMYPLKKEENVEGNAMGKTYNDPKISSQELRHKKARAGDVKSRS